MKSDPTLNSRGIDQQQPQRAMKHHGFRLPTRLSVQVAESAPRYDVCAISINSPIYTNGSFFLTFGHVSCFTSMVMGQGYPLHGLLSLELVYGNYFKALSKEKKCALHKAPPAKSFYFWWSI